MTEMVLDIHALPDTIFSKFTTKKVNLYENNGTIILTPFSEEKLQFDHLIGMFSGGGKVVDEFLEEKRKEMELEI